LSESAAVPLLVVSSARDPVEAVNALLRRQGIAAHCTWVASLKELDDRLDESGAQLLLCVPGDGIGVADVNEVRSRSHGAVPLVAVRPEITEELMAEDLTAGARDTINLAQPQRAHQVCSSRSTMRSTP